MWAMQGVEQGISKETSDALVIRRGASCLVWQEALALD